MGPNFEGLSLENSLRYFLGQFRIFGEGGVVGRVMEEFANQFCYINSSEYLMDKKDLKEEEDHADKIIAPLSDLSDSDGDEFDELEPKPHKRSASFNINNFDEFGNSLIKQIALESDILKEHPVDKIKIHASGRERANSKRKQDSESEIQWTAKSVLVIGFSVLMLNTDLHNRRLESNSHSRMTKTQYLKNLKGQNDGRDFPK